MCEFNHPTKNCLHCYTLNVFWLVKILTKELSFSCFFIPSFLPLFSIRGHVQCCSFQWSLCGDLRLPGPPHTRAPGVCRATSKRPVPVAPGCQCRRHERRSTREHHFAGQTFPVQPDAAVPAGARSGKVPETKVQILP